MGDAAATAHFSIGSGTKLALESAMALANYVNSEPDLEAAFRKYEDARRIEVLRLQSAARNSLEWFEEVERYFAPRSGAVQLFAADPLAAHQPRESAAARPDLAGRRRGLVPAAGRRAAMSVRAPMFAPFRLRDLKLEEPRRRLADGAVQGGRRLPDRLALRPLRRARQGRRRAGLYRDDLRQPGRPHHAGLHRLLCARARDRRGSASSISCMRETEAQDLLPARPFRPEGLDPARLGGEATRRWQAATGR